MWITLLKGLIAGAIVVAVIEVGPKYPRIGGLLLTLPLVSILAFLMAWTKQGDLPAISALAKETLILVPLGLPFFIPLAFADRLGLSFWSAMATGFLLASASIGLYFWFLSSVPK
jgi:hypothetical protein